MQHIVNTADTEAHPVLTKLKAAVSTLIWAAGLILAGSDGPLMPYLNLLGAILFAGSCLWLARQARNPFLNLTCRAQGKRDGPLDGRPLLRPSVGEGGQFRFQ